MNFLKRLFGSTGESKSSQPATKSKHWRCPNCSGLLEKGVGDMFGAVVGVATCGGCGSKFSQSDVYGGKFDVEERTIDATNNFRLIGSTAMWGDGHQVTFSNDHTAIELSWLLDGDLLPVGSQFTQDECRGLVEGNFRKALDVATRSRKSKNLPKPGDADVYTLVITKFQLSYAVRNNVAFPESVRIFRTTMGFT